MRRETESAIRAATIAQQIADSRDGADRVTSKGGIDIVTAADLACEDAIRKVLADAFPEYPVIGEERAGDAIAGRPYWLVDPICGTRAFASNVPLYCTNIALVENGAVTVAAIGMGRTGELLFSERGMGAWMRTSQGDQRVHAGTISNTLWIDGETEHAANVVRRALLMDQWYVWLFSSSVFYAHLAAGRISGIIHFGTESSAHGSVHTAAGCFMASEAGAVLTDLDSGGPWSLPTQSYLLAATPELHRELSELVRREGKGT